MLTNCSPSATQQRYSNGRKQHLVAKDNLRKHSWVPKKSTDQLAWINVGSGQNHGENLHDTDTSTKKSCHLAEVIEPITCRVHHLLGGNPSL